MRFLIAFVITFFSLSANVLAQDYTSTVFIPISVDNNTVKEMIAESTDHVLVLSDSLEMSKYTYNLDIVDKETKLWKNKITHTIEFVDGHGTQSSRTGMNNPIAYGGKLYSPWINLRCKEIRGSSTADIVVNITPDYQIVTDSKFTAEIKNAKCNGVKVNRMMKFLGYDTVADTMSYVMNENLKEMHLRDNIEKIWFDIQKPIEVDSDTYILIEPEKLIYKDFYFDKHKLKFGLGIQMKMGVTNANDANKWNIFKPLPLLEKVSNVSDPSIHFKTPIKINYKTLEAQIKDKMVGEYITKEKKGKEKKIAKILDVTVDHSPLEGYDIVIGTKVKFYKYFKKKKGFIYFHADLDYDKELGRVEVLKYKVDSKINSWLANTSINAGANVFFKKELENSMVAEITDQIEMVRTRLNEFMKDEVQIQDGLTFNGEIQNFQIEELYPQEDEILLIIDAMGNVELNITKLPEMEE